jgi:uncharacterized protein YbjT (DUF2867 family)
MSNRLLLTGASGFVGHRTYPALVRAGWDVVCASRDARAAAEREPQRAWVTFDLENADSVEAALRGVDVVLYLVHAMGQDGDFEAKERLSAETFVRACQRAGVKRVVYLGGVAPSGEPSKHLRSRLSTGRILRDSIEPTVELRAGMIVGAGGVSWRMVRDLAARLPFMILPRWLQNRSQPIAADDVVAALVCAAALPGELRGVFDLPGPEVLSGEDILKRIARLLGSRPYTIRVPVLTPRLSSYWLKLITRADFDVAQELVEGLTSDLLASNEPFWNFMPDVRPTPFDEAAKAALDEAAELPLGTRALEWTLQHVGRRA